MQTHSLRRNMIPAPLAVLLAVVLSACGGASSGASGAASAAHAGDPARAAALVAETFGANANADSGVVNGTITISIKGIRRFGQPLTLSTTGPFSDSPGNDMPDSDQTVSLDNYGAGMTTLNGKVWLDIGTAAFRIPQSIVALMSQAASGAHNTLSKALAPLGVRIERWIRDPRVAGDTTIAGVKVVHLTTNIDTTRMFLDANSFMQFLTALQIMQLAGLPESITPAARSALVRSITTARGDVYTGAIDHVVRAANLSLALAVAPADRKLLGGMTSVTVDAKLSVTEVGQPQQIHVLPQRLPYHNAYLLLQAAAYSHRTPAERGE